MAIVLCSKELRMATSKDTGLTLDKMAERLQVLRISAHKLSQEGNIRGRKN